MDKEIPKKSCMADAVDEKVAKLDEIDHDLIAVSNDLQNFDQL